MRTTRKADPDVRVAFFPNSWRANPYLGLLEGGLREAGVDVCPAEVDRPLLAWLKEHRGRVDVLHFHWLDYMYRRDCYRKSLIRVLKFGGQLAWARRSGYRVVWTVHNLYPHEPLYPHLDRLVRRLIVYMADAVLVHCNSAKAEVKRLWGRCQGVYVAPLGNYSGVHGEPVDKAAARYRLGLSARFVFLCLGQIRGYKGLEEVAQALGQLPDRNVLLLIAGKISDLYGDAGAGMVQDLQKQPQVVVRSGWIPDDMIPVYYGAADAVVCPFTRVLTSSSAMLGLSMARPVVAPALGCLPELITPDVGIVYDPAAPDSLREALGRCTAMDVVEMGRNARRVAEAYDWRAMAEVVRAAYAAKR